MTAAFVSRETTPLTPRGVQRLTGLPSEVISRFADLLSLLRDWQQRINLVGRGTLADPWRRHILDSVQLLPILTAASPLGSATLDLGSGAGFPGLVLAIAGLPKVVLVESDNRKSAFLREAARLCRAPVEIRTTRAEHIPGPISAAITARACAPLPQLLQIAAPLLLPGGRCVLLKGRDIRRELTAASKAWTMAATLMPSQADPEGVVLVIDGLRKRHG